MSKVKDKVDDKPTGLNLTYAFVENAIIHRLTGEILTIIDSAVIDPRQNKAIKDLIKSRIKDCVWSIQKCASGIDAGKGVGRWGKSINFPKELNN